MDCCGGFGKEKVAYSDADLYKRLYGLNGKVRPDGMSKSLMDLLEIRSARFGLIESSLKEPSPEISEGGLPCFPKDPFSLLSPWLKQNLPSVLRLSSSFPIDF